MNDSNLSAPPGAVPNALNEAELKNTLVIAKRQKALLITYLCYILLGPLSSIVLVVKALAPLLLLVVLLAIGVLTARLSIKVYPTWVTIIFVMLSIVPGLNLLIILATNARANEAIKSNGFNVGFMGVPIANIKSMMETIQSPMKPV